jgi:hypothetical protein
VTARRCAAASWRRHPIARRAALLLLQKVPEVRSFAGVPSLIDFLYESCLFPVAAPAVAQGSSVTSCLVTGVEVVCDTNDDDDASFGPICKTSVSRRAAYSLLCALCDGAGNVERLSRALTCVEGVELAGGMEGRETKKWDYDPSSMLKAPKQYVGLKNQVRTDRCSASLSRCAA